ncbi:MAG TPA: glycosyltransferase [Gaiellaceae bacterium]|nr:glycosyltransferase [Gaiellaceae bacterium]
MRLLFTFSGGTGHFLPTLPLARAAAAAGHEVAYACQEPMVERVRAAGFDAHETGGRTLLAPGERLPLLELDLQRERDAVTHGFAGRTARERAQRVREVAERLRPDVVVREELDFGAAVAAEALGQPHATVLSIAAGEFDWVELAAAPLNELRAEHGLPPDPELAFLERDLVLSPFPPSFRARPLPPTGVALRPTFEEPGEPWPESEHPLVWLTLGTVFNQESGDLFERALAGLAQLPVAVVATVGRELDPSFLGQQPSRVRIEQYVPQARLLRACALVVAHAGSGSVIGALAHGVPMVLLPIGADQPQNARRCEELGAAVALDSFRATADDVRGAAAQVLADDSYRAAAERVRDEIAALPPPKTAVPLLERLANRRSSA